MPRYDRRTFMKAGAACAAGLGPLRPARAGLPEAADGLAAEMKALVANGYVPGVVWALERQGEARIGAAGHFRADGTGPEMAEETIFRIASITKPLTAATAMRLVEDGALSLDGPVDALLPELADPRVLRRPDGPLDDTVAAEGPVTLRHLLTNTYGHGAVMLWPESWPVQAAMREAGFAPGPTMPRMTPDEYMAAVGSVPLVAQPGEMFLYNTGLDVAGILIERAAGAPFADVMQTLLLEPLGMADTGFFVPEEKRDRLPPVYWPGEDGMLTEYGPEKMGSDFATPPAMASGAGGAVSTVPDYLRFLRMLRDGGASEGAQVLRPESVAEMMKNQLTDAQRAEANALPFMFDGGGGWGLGGSVALEAVEPWLTPGRYGWDGGFGTSAYVDPAEGTIAIMMSQRMMTSPAPAETNLALWRAEVEAGR